MSRYLEHFNLKEDPFRLTPDPSFYYPSQEHVTALSSLGYCMEQKEGFCLLTGEPGTGKTTLLRVFMNEWKEKAEIALVLTPHLTPSDFLQAVLDDLGVRVAGPGKNEMIKAFRDFLIGHSESGRSVAIIVDEAQNLPAETLEELRLLSNLETDREKLLQIILIGQPELERKLQQEGLKQLDQRIAVRVSLHPLSAECSGAYLTARLVKAGNGSEVFDREARKKIHSATGGIPRLINIVAARALMVAYLEGHATVRMPDVSLGLKDLRTERATERSYRRNRLSLSHMNRIDLFLLVSLVTAIVAVGMGIWLDISFR